MACTYGVFSPRPVRTTAGISIVAIQAAWLRINTAASAGLRLLMNSCRASRNPRSSCGPPHTF